MPTQDSGIRNHPIVSHEKWIAARTALLAKEKEFTKLRDELSRQRRDLPWEKVEKQYVFETPGDGKETLAQLFGKHSQLVVYHFMFGPDMQQGCKHCSFWADHFDPMGVHLAHRDVTFVVISRALLAKIEPFKKRMGWQFKWVSSAGNDFNFDYQASFRPEQIKSGAVFYNYRNEKIDMTEREGVSVFYKASDADLFHTYSTYARGIDMLNNTYHLLDIVPKGRDEGDSPQSWVQYHDKYKD